MTRNFERTDAVLLDSSTDLETVLAAWHTATVRLEQTHEALRGEVHRLTDELEEKNRELARKNRLSDLGQMAAHVAHEVRNKLVPVTLYLSLLRRRIQGDEGRAAVLDKIQAAFTDLEATVNDLLSFTTDRKPHLQTFSLGELVEDVYASLVPQLSAQGIEVLTELDQIPPVTADRDMICRAVLNLVLNALDAMPDGGRLTFRMADGPQGVELSIADSGPGFDAHTRQRMFEPFYSTKQGGTGLGLAIVSRAAEVHGGQVIGDSRPGHGATFTLRIPRQRREAAA
jgi:signal transduction histidine kinase